MAGENRGRSNGPRVKRRRHDLEIPLLGLGDCFGRRSRERRDTEADVKQGVSFRCSLSDLSLASALPHAGSAESSLAGLPHLSNSGAWDLIIH